MRLKVLHRAANFLAGRIMDAPGLGHEDRLAIISHIEFAWLAQFCPPLTQGFPPESLDALQYHSVSMYLDGLFFQDPPLPPQPDDLDGGSESEWLLHCALRFDGYAYQDEHDPRKTIYDVGLAVLRGDAVPDALTVEERMTLMFLLQRGLMKEGVRSKTDAGWKTFRELFIELVAEPVPVRYRMAGHYEAWQRRFAPIFPVGKKLIQHLHETCQYDAPR